MQPGPPAEPAKTAGGEREGGDAEVSGQLVLELPCQLRVIAP